MTYLSQMPKQTNQFHASHVTLLRDSFQHWVGRDLLNYMGIDQVGENSVTTDLAERVFKSRCALLSHDTSPDPLLTYGNQQVLDLFELSWGALLMMPSRLTAEAVNRSERARLLKQVSRFGYIDNYSGIRISKNGKRFRISQAIVWNLLNSDSVLTGQAAVFRDWEPLQ